MRPAASSSAAQRPTRNNPVCVLGAGSFGTALAAHLARNGFATTVWARDAQLIDQLRAGGENTRYLPGVALPASLAYQYHLSDCLSSCTDVLIALPSSGFEFAIEQISIHCKPGTGVIWACKGLQKGSGQLLGELLVERLGAAVDHAVISGPTFARELAEDLPTALTVAANKPAYAAKVSSLLHCGRLRAYASHDMRGVQLGGALKNVYAIAAGISDGLGFGANARVALITRGLAEMRRLGEQLGADAETLSGLSGTGDLILTCTDDQSRNRRFGLALAKGLSVADAVASIGQSVEGVAATAAAQTLAQRYDVEMPIVEQVDAVVNRGSQPLDAVQALLERAPRDEGC